MLSLLLSKITFLGLLLLLIDVSPWQPDWKSLLESKDTLPLHLTWLLILNMTFSQMTEKSTRTVLRASLNRPIRFHHGTRRLVLNYSWRKWFCAKTREGQPSTKTLTIRVSVGDIVHRFPSKTQISVQCWDLNHVTTWSSSFTYLSGLGCVYKLGRVIVYVIHNNGNLRKTRTNRKH